MLELANKFSCAGGTFALYSLICRHAKVSLAHSQVPTDLNISNYKLEKPTRRFARATRIKEKLEKSKFLQNVLIVTVLCGTCLVIGDGTLTPAISGTKSNQFRENIVKYVYASKISTSKYLRPSANLILALRKSERHHCSVIGLWN